MSVHETKDEGLDGRRISGPLVHQAATFFLLAVAVVWTGRAFALLLWQRAQLAPWLGFWRWPLLLLYLVGCGLAVVALVRGLEAWRMGRWQVRGFGALRVFVYGLFVAWLGALLLNGSFRPELYPLASGAAGAVFALFSLLGISGRLQQRGPLLAAVDIVLLNLCLLTVGAELGMRVVGTLRPSVLLARPGTAAVRNVEGARYAPGTIRHGFPVNRGGHYDEEFVPRRDGEQLVVAVGDSFSASIVHHSLHFTTVAEKLLQGVPVYNMGLPSIGPPEYAYLAIHEALPLHPNVVVINIFAGNDLSYPLPEDQHRSPVELLFNRENLLLFQVPERVRRLARAGEEQLAALDGTAAAGDETEVLRTPDEVRQHFPWIDDPLSEPPRLALDHFMKIERHTAARLSQMSALEIGQRLEPLRTIVRAADDCVVLVMIIPDRYQVEDDLWARVRPKGATADGRWRSLWVTQAWLEREKIPFLNLTPLLRQVPPLEDGSSHLYHRQDTHFNARGNRVAGQALAEFLAPYLDLETTARESSPVN